MFNAIKSLFTRVPIQGDVVPGATGEYGLDIANPIPTSGVDASEVYLSKLRTLSGEPVSVRRRMSVSSPAVPGRICDEYVLKDGTAKVLGSIYLCPYFERTSTTAPPGFYLEQTAGKSNLAASQEPGSPEALPPRAFPGGLKQAVREAHELRGLLERRLSFMECKQVVLDAKVLVNSKFHGTEEIREVIQAKGGGKLTEGDIETIVEFLQEKVALVPMYVNANEAEQSFTQFKKCLAMGAIASREGRFVEAATAFKDSLRHLEINNEDANIAQILAMVGYQLDAKGDRTRAANYHRRCAGVYLFAPAKPNEYVCASLAYSSRMLFEIQRYQDAEEYALQALAIADKLGIRQLPAPTVALYVLGLIVGKVKGDKEQANRLIQEADANRGKSAHRSQRI